MKKYYFLSISCAALLFISGCNNSSTTKSMQPKVTASAAPSSGNYKSDSVGCYDYFSHAPTTSASLVSGQDFITLKGDQLTSVTTSNNCTVKITAKIIFNPDRSTVDMINRRVIEASNGQCDLTVNISNGTHNIIPISYTSTYAAGDELPDILNNYYTQVGNDFAYSVYYYRNNINLQDACFVFYRSQP